MVPYHQFVLDDIWMTYVTSTLCIYYFSCSTFDFVHQQYQILDLYFRQTAECFWIFSLLQSPTKTPQYKQPSSSKKNNPFFVTVNITSKQNTSPQKPRILFPLNLDLWFSISQVFQVIFFWGCEIPSESSPHPFHRPPRHLHDRGTFMQRTQRWTNRRIEATGRRSRTDLRWTNGPGSWSGWKIQRKTYLCCKGWLYPMMDPWDSSISLISHHFFKSPS